MPWSMIKEQASSVFLSSLLRWQSGYGGTENDLGKDEIVRRRFDPVFDFLKGICQSSPEWLKDEMRRSTNFPSFILLPIPKRGARLFMTWHFWCLLVLLTRFVESIEISFRTLVNMSLCQMKDVMAWQTVPYVCWELRNFENHFREYQRYCRPLEWYMGGNLVTIQRGSLLCKFCLIALLVE